MTWLAGIVKTAVAGGVVVAKTALVRENLALAPAATRLLLTIPEWELVHIPTGHVVCIIIAQEARAVQLADLIHDVTDWSFQTLDGWRNCDPDLVSKVQALRDAHRSEIFPARSDVDRAAADKIRGL